MEQKRVRNVRSEWRALEKRTEFQSQTCEKRSTLEDPGVEGRIILKWYLKKRDMYRIYHSRDKCVCVCVCVCGVDRFIEQAF